MHNQPLVSVIMPLYNSEMYVEAAIQSILNQTYFNLELIVVDDCSVDKSANIVKSIQDKRIQFHQLPANLGISNALNTAISLCKGDFIARMDADDISVPCRIEKQVSYLLSNPNCVVIGSAFQIIGEEDTRTVIVGCSNIKSHTLVANPLAHPTVMMRALLFKEMGLYYNKQMEPAEDYDLWVRALLNGALIENLPESLLKYRKHEGQITSKNRMLSDKKSKIVRLNILKLYEFEKETQTYLEEILSRKCSQVDLVKIIDIQETLNKLSSKNTEKKLLDEDALKLIISKCLIYYMKIANFDCYIQILKYFDKVIDLGLVVGWRFFLAKISRINYTKKHVVSQPE